MQCFYMILLFILRPHTVFFRIMPVEQNLMSRSGSMDVYAIVSALFLQLIFAQSFQSRNKTNIARNSVNTSHQSGLFTFKVEPGYFFRIPQELL